MSRQENCSHTQEQCMSLGLDSARERRRLMGMLTLGAYWLFVLLLDCHDVFKLVAVLATCAFGAACLVWPPQKRGGEDSRRQDKEQ